MVADFLSRCHSEEMYLNANGHQQPCTSLILGPEKMVSSGILRGRMCKEEKKRVLILPRSWQETAKEKRVVFLELLLCEVRVAPKRGRDGEGPG